MASIFISIAAYHDYELPKTMLSAISNSSGNHEIYFGVHLAYYEKNDIPVLDYDKAKYVYSKAPKNIGVNIGRNICNSLYSGQDYFLQIDSHTRFAKNWDTDLISDIGIYKHLGFKKPALTCYPAIYFYNENGEEVLDIDPKPQNIDIEDEQLFFDTYKVVNVSRNRDTFLQKSVSGGFIFLEGGLPSITDKIVFSEEFPLGAVLYTNGYDLLIPRTLPIFHYYSGPSDIDPVAHNRRHVWADPRFRKHLMNLVYSTDNEIINMFKNNIVADGYLGSERTLDEYGKYAGLDFMERKFIK